MSKPVYYLAHPVTGDPEGNAFKAIAWIHWLTLKDPDAIYVAPWVAEVLAFARENNDPAFYERVLKDDQVVVQHLDGLLLVGGTISNGMQKELDAALEYGMPVVDWSDYATPTDVPEGWTPSGQAT